MSSKLCFPLVVKPRCGSLSHHVTTNIQTAEELQNAIAIVKEYTNNYIVEKYIPGDVFRITVITANVFAVKRLPATIIGDGMNTVQALIEQYNAHPYRGEPHQKNATLYKIVIDEETKKMLQKQHLSLETIIPRGLRAHVKEKVNLGSAAEVIEVTEALHKANKTLFLNIAELLQTEILGIDFICKDISVPWYQQECGVIECNSVPYIDMHQFPSKGKRKYIAKYVVELIKQAHEK